MRKRNNGFTWIFLIVAVIMLGVAAFAGYTIVSKLYHENDTQNLYDDLAGTYIKPAENTPEPLTPDGEVYSEFSPITVDFDELLAKNEDVIGWLYQPGEDCIINYPVVQGDDNEYYVDRNLSGHMDGVGTIFLDVSCSPDFSTPNNILYGHHMVAGTMFASIVNYYEQEFYDEHPVMYLNTPAQNYKVEIFACYVTEPTSEVYTPYFADDVAFMQWYEKAYDQSLIQTDVKVDATSRILTLSTCSYQFKDARTVVQGVLTPIG